MKDRTEKVGIGLVGYGMIGKVHALAYREIPLIYPGVLPRLKLAAVCTTNEQSAQKAARDGGFEGWTTSIEELLSRDDVDVVDICSPNFAHREVILAALRAGKHVIVDKPLARNAVEAQEIAEATTAGKARLGMVFNYRFVPALMLAHKMIAEGNARRHLPFSFRLLAQWLSESKSPDELAVATRRIRRGARWWIWVRTSLTWRAICWANLPNSTQPREPM